MNRKGVEGGILYKGFERERGRERSYLRTLSSLLLCVWWGGGGGGAEEEGIPYKDFKL